MKCPFCASQENKVVDSRTNESANSIRRRRACVGCGRRFTSYETVEIIPALVVKRDGSRQPFDSVKIRNGIIKACEKRPVTMEQINGIVDKIEKSLLSSPEQEVESKTIGDIIMKELKKLDEISYVRFAAVYRQFKDISTFLDFIKNLDKTDGTIA